VGIRLTKAFIFDFDGTLVDSQYAIYQCFQSITKKLAPERLEYAKKILIGPPLRDTASEILGPDHQNSLDEFVQLFIQMHDEQVIEHTQPYPDVIQVLKQLHTMNIPMAVATNKRLAPTKKLIKYYDWEKYFYTIECSDSLTKVRDKTKMIQDIFSKNLVFKNSYFVGDTRGDAIAANENSLKFIYAKYGYGTCQTWDNIYIYKEIYSIKEIEKFLISTNF
jgi:phosphoglycolate phosphatase